MAGSRFDTNQTTIPLFYIRMRGGAATTSLTVSVSVVNASTGSSLLSLTSCTETPATSGLYGYSWTHGLAVTNECIATYSVTDASGTKLYKEHFSINSSTDAIESGEGKAE